MARLVVHHLNNEKVYQIQGKKSILTRKFYAEKWKFSETQPNKSGSTGYDQ